jgi:hypothetical protein
MKTMSTEQTNRIDQNARAAMVQIMRDDTEDILDWKTTARTAYSLAFEMEHARKELLATNNLPKQE